MEENMNKPSKVLLTNKIREYLNGYLFISLWLIGFIIFKLVPLSQSIFYSLNDADFFSDTIKLEFIMFDNYKHAFLGDVTFPMLLLDYVKEIFINVSIAVVFALLIAMLINSKVKFRGFWRVVFFLPVVISSGPIIDALVNQGASTVPLLNNPEIQGFIETNLPAFLNDPILALFNQLIMVLWFSGIPILIFLAGLQKIDRSTYEAASIDGASPWESFWKITLPAVKSFIMVNIIYSVVTLSYYAGFAGNEIIQYIEDESIINVIDGRGFGYGSAIAWIFFIVIILVIGVFMLLLNLKRK